LAVAVAVLIITAVLTLQVVVVVEEQDLIVVLVQRELPILAEAAVVEVGFNEVVERVVPE
jgi:hypothetical protein